jgi:hypothetical protein
MLDDKYFSCGQLTGGKKIINDNIPYISSLLETKSLKIVHANWIEGTDSKIELLESFYNKL